MEEETGRHGLPTWAIVLLIPVLIPILIPACLLGLLVQLLGQDLPPERRTPAEVAAVLRAVLDGTITYDDWDDFICVRIANRRLEEIRQSLADLPDDDPEEIFGAAEEREVVRGFLAEIEAHLERAEPGD